MVTSTYEIVNLLNEIGMLAQIPRSGFAFLGSGKQSVAEHSFRVVTISYALSRLIKEPIDQYKLMMMCLFHDLPEARIGDLNYVQKKYVTPRLDKALEELANGSCLGPEIVTWIQEYEEGKTLEAQIAHDADQIELLLMLKQEQEMGNIRTNYWIAACCKRIKTEAGQHIAETICQTLSTDWWAADKSDPHWVHGGKTDPLS